MRIRRDKRGFTLIELLIVVAIIGIIVAIAIPNLLNAIQRAKQKRTMADMRSIGTAAEAYAVDTNQYPGAAGCTLPTTLNPSSWSRTFGSSVQDVLQPTYIKTLPLKDGWNSFFSYQVSTSAQDYGILSAGKNGSIDGCTGGATTDFNSDIIFSDGQFIQWPEGMQK